MSKDILYTRPKKRTSYSKGNTIRAVQKNFALSKPTSEMGQTDTLHTSSNTIRQIIMSRENSQSQEDQLAAQRTSAQLFNI
jgi:hypothetical protein